MMELKPNIKFPGDLGDRDKLDVRICRVVSVDDILKNPKKEHSNDNPVKAYHLTVSTGEEVRDIVTNIVDKYSKEDLLDKEVAFILNMEPATIRGVESRGMIFLDDEEKLIFGNTGDIL